MPNEPIWVRPAETSDAAALIAYVQKLAEEPGINILIYPGEFQYTVEEEAQIIASYAAVENSLFLVALDHEEIVGVLTLKGGARRATQHMTTLGISVAQEWRNQGVGGQLMAAALDWARQSGVLRRIELNVLVRNQPGIHLYKKFGFEIEGRRRQAAFREGEYLDDYVMGLILNQPG